MVTILEQNTKQNCVVTDTSVEKRYRQVVLHKERAEQITNNYDNMTYDADFFSGTSLQIVFSFVVQPSV
jgi:hypothetical protein